MNSINPAHKPKDALPLDVMLEKMGGMDMDDIAKMINGEGASGQVNRDVAIAMYYISQSENLKIVVEWLADLTVRRMTIEPGETIEKNALAFERLKERRFLMMMFAQAINEGQQIAEKAKK